MKSYIAILFSLAATTASHADPLNSVDHSTLLNALAASYPAARMNEVRSFYFAGTHGQLIQVDNDVDSVAVSVTPKGGAERALGVSIFSQKDTVETVTETKDGTFARNTNYFQFQGQRTVFETDDLTVVRAQSTGNQLSVSVVTTTYFKFVIDNKTNSSVPVKLATPTVESAKVTANLVLTLNNADAAAMGVEAVKKVGEDRDAGSTTCNIISATQVGCDYGLPTDYTPDTLHSTFSIKNGKVDQLIDASVEPGC